MNICLSVILPNSDVELINRGLAPKTPLPFLARTKKGSKKVQDYARFARKIGARTAKSSKLAPSSLKQGRFLTPLSLIFRLTGRGQSGAKRIFIYDYPLSFSTTFS
jgi:hypothetical protein